MAVSERITFSCDRHTTDGMDLTSWMKSEY